jgi:DNA-binding response OmpR family regulator
VVSISPANSVAVPAKAVLLVSVRAQIHDSLRSIFRDSPWELQEAWTASDGRQTIRRNHHEIPVVICEHSLPDGDWKLVLAELDKVAVRPSLIVSSRLADERLWAEVLNLGAFDLLLGAPFEPEEVLRVTESAWSAWNSAARRSAHVRVGPEPARNLADCVARPLAVGSRI